MQLTLRDYQERAIQLLRDGIVAGHKAQLLYLSTGGGKTDTSAFLLQEAARKGTKACFVVDRRAIVNQTSERLLKYGIDHGVIMADHLRDKPWCPVQVASAQTLEARGFYPDLKLLVIDETHVIRRSFVEYIKARPDLIVVGLTATPFTAGLADIYTNVVSVKTTDELTSDGWLVPLKVYAAKAPDMTGAKVVAGEWADSEIETRGTEIIGDIVEEWASKTRLHFGRKVKTIVFSATVAHGEELCRQFQGAGFNFRLVSYLDGNNAKREELLADFARKDTDIDGLVSCEALGRGLDVPDILCGISARPYRKSLSSHVQQVGRVLRPAPDKSFALWLDHSGNYIRFYKDMVDVFANGVSSLSEAAKKDSVVRKEPTEKEKKELKCSCGYVLFPGCPQCPSCGKERVKRSLVEQLPGKLHEFNPKPKKAEPPPPLWQGDPSRAWMQICGSAMQRKKGDVVAARKWALGQYKSLFDKWPNEPFNPAAPPHIDMDLQARITSNTIRWAKSRAQRMKDEVRAMNLGKE